MAPNWLGDSVMALPAIRDVRRHFSSQTLTIAARSSVAPVFRAVPGVDAVTIVERGKESSQLRGDTAILLPNSFRSAWVVRQAGIKERWGYRSDFRGLLLTRSIRRPRKRVSFPEYYSNLVRQLGIEIGPLTAKLELQTPVSDAALNLLSERGWSGQPLVGIAPGAAFGHAKRWPRSRFAELAARLTRDLGVLCVILGRSEDRDITHEIQGIDLIGATDLPMLMGVISHCRALVANDSGALHLAAALGVPIAGIYGPTDERYSTPLTPFETSVGRVVTISESVFCRPCHLADCPIDHRCMKRIPAARVFDVVRGFLQEASA